MNRSSIPIITFILIFFPFLLSAKNLTDNFEDFLIYQETFTKSEVEEKILSMLQKHKEIEDWYSIKEDRLEIYSSPKDKGEEKPEFVLKFGNRPKVLSEFPLSYHPQLPLKGIRIAIDAGHVGAEYAHLEERYIDMPACPQTGLDEDLQFDEGTLSTMTAKRLAEKFKSLGAKVLLTRIEAGKPVLKTSFSEWFEKDFFQAVERLTADITDLKQKQREEDLWLHNSKPTDIFRSTYNFLELEKRAEIINTFAPHVTISCHYNLGGIYDKQGKTPGTTDDYTLFFVPGAFQRGGQRDENFRNSSLKNPRSRYEFIRLLVTDHIHQSILLAEITQEYASNILHLPTDCSLNYLKVLCLPNKRGIYHRNLTLTRLVHSPILYCEPLCQDNYKQVQILAKEPKKITDKVADIYFRAVMDWLDENFSSNNRS